MGSQDYVKRIVEAMSGVLQPAGFRKKGLVFTAEREGMFSLVQLYKGKLTTLKEASVCLPYGVFAPALDQAIARVCGRTERVDLPTRFDGCHWHRSWPGGQFQFWKLSDCVLASNNEEAERAAEEIAWQLRETVLPELEKRTPASRFLDQLCLNARGLQSKDGYRGLMEWAAALGKSVNYRGEVLTEENFDRVMSTSRQQGYVPKPAPPSPPVDLTDREAATGRLEEGVRRECVREGLRVRLSRRKTWYFWSSGNPDQPAPVPAGAVGTLYEMDEPPAQMRQCYSVFAVWFDEYDSPSVQLLDNSFEKAYFVIEGSEGAPLPPYLEAVEADATG